MCTVTYIPTNDGFVFTSNRDEHVSRSKTNFPESLTVGGEPIFFPKDPLSKGSWIAASKSRVVCLLNGAFAKHKHLPPYRKSRGLIVLDAFHYDSFETFAQQINLNDIEPFTLISIEIDALENMPKITELVWDGSKKHYAYKNVQQKHIWSSSTLYDHDLKQKRAEIFRDLDPKNAEEILYFHQNEGKSLGLANQFKMKRAGGLETISTTQIIKNDFLNVHYYNYIMQETNKLMVNGHLETLKH